MFDIYVNKRGEWLVIPRGVPISTIDGAPSWRKKKSTIAVSDEIRLAVGRDGYYKRRSPEIKKRNQKCGLDASIGQIEDELAVVEAGLAKLDLKGQA